MEAELTWLDDIRQKIGEDALVAWDACLQTMHPEVAALCNEAPYLGVWDEFGQRALVTSFGRRFIAVWVEDRWIPRPNADASSFHTLRDAVRAAYRKKA